MTIMSIVETLRCVLWIDALSALRLCIVYQIWCIKRISNSGKKLRFHTEKKVVLSM